MDWGNYLFGFKGRVNRAKMWLLYPVLWAAEFALGVAMLPLVLISQTDGDRSGNLFQASAMIVMVAVMAIFMLLAYTVMAAVTVKRLHDRDKSAWWLLVFYVGPLLLVAPALFFAGPIIANAETTGFPTALALAMAPGMLLSFWGFVETHVLAGTPGENRFGADPLAAHSKPYSL
jgi:uncharacterized membrane protein YhaH (DUF805 family)